ncbi:LTA synthase family protein ['Paenibacillus yunnanensis' Narsing Rao et al. 2020]|uniref:LTA synthase family protein n=1 Tax=Paenibacillus tengchongensis TaxID=2608684 RepID=UPI00124E1DE4|nr:LTA synthase family protein [Paenibacillus tengchongensis]
MRLRYNHQAGRGLRRLAAVLLLSGFILNFILQLASFNLDVYAVLAWISEYYWLFLAGALCLFLLLLCSSVILPNLYTGPAVTGFLLIAVAAAAYKKQGTTGEPLFPWDLLMLRNAPEMLRITQGMISPLMLAAAVLLIGVLVWLIRKLPTIQVRMTLRLAVLLAGLFGIAGFVDMVSAQSPLTATMKYENLFWNQKVNYSRNGFVFAFTGNLRQNLLEEPEGYSREAIAVIADKYAAETGETRSGLQPNILFMMDEAFFDPVRMSAYQYSEDPLPFIRQAAEDNPSGYLLSPEFGGNTANVEFEALTGLSMYFLNDGAIPYQQRIVKMDTLPSIVSILKARGYTAQALHPYDRTFYNRNRVYPTLGFDEFTSEEDMPDAERLTPNAYISDRAAVAEAVGKLRSASGPAFVHLVTMQNHFPFTKGQNGPNTVSVTGVPEKNRDELETYAQITKLTDEALVFLQQELQTIQRPTIAVFWGDHLPALSDGIYTAADWNGNPRLKHETTLLILANFELGEQQLGTLSPVFLGPEVFRLTGQDMPPFYRMLTEVRSELPGLSKSVLLGKSGEELRELNAHQQALLNDYLLVEYDLLEGGQYAADLMF